MFVEYGRADTAIQPKLEIGPAISHSGSRDGNMPLVVSSRHSLLDLAVKGSPLSREDALFLYTSAEVELERLAEAARQLRSDGKGKNRDG